MSNPEEKDANAAGGLVAATGGGVRPEEVIIVPHGKIGTPRKPKTAGKHLGFNVQVPLLPSNWITWATVAGPQLIDRFDSNWLVPAIPQTWNSQLLYIFNGVQNAAKTHILQPVLQYGISAFGGGRYWSIMPTFVDNASNSLQIPQAGLVQVVPGTSLTGFINLLGQANGACSYECGFLINGQPGPKLQMSTDPVVEAVETLEVYRLSAPTDYPSQAATTFITPNLVVGGAPVHPAWAVVDRVKQYGEHSIAYPDGHVDIFY